MSLTVTTRELTQPAEVWALAAAWDGLLARSASSVLFLTHAFQSIWWEWLGVGRLQVLVGESGAGQPLFIAPLYISQVEGLGRTVRPIGGSEVADYLDIIAAPEDIALAWRQIFEHWRGTADAWDTIDLRALPEWSPSRALVSDLATEFGWTCTMTIDEVCPVIAPLAPTWEGYLAGLRKPDRHELRRKIRRLENLVQTDHFGLIGPDDDLTTAINDFFALHRKSGQDKDGFWHPRMEAFFRAIIIAAQQQGWLRLSFQTINGVRAAAVLSFRYGDRYYVYNSGYDPAYRDVGVGVVCMGRTIQGAIADGATIFDLLQGNEPYKYDFGAVDTQVYRCIITR